MPEIHGRALALGTFDGVHLAHRTLVENAAMAGGPNGATAITFDRIPGSLLGTNGKTRQIVTLKDKIELLIRAGAGEVEVLKFDENLSNMEAEKFFEEFIVRKFRPSTLTVGHDYRFGRRGRGDVAMLERLCAQAGIRINVLDEMIKDGIRISSTEIRRRIASGEPEEASEMLGRVHFFRVVRSEGQLRLENGIELPPEGIWFETAVFPQMPIVNSFECLQEAFSVKIDATGPTIELKTGRTGEVESGSYILFGPRA